MIKSMRQLASVISKQEGKKHEASVGDVREVLGIISDLVYAQELEEFWKMFFENGKKRAEKKGKKK